MSTIPHRHTHALLLGLLLIDLPVFTAVAALGFVYGFRETYWAISNWRLHHLWSLIPSVLLAAWIIRKWWNT